MTRTRDKERTRGRLIAAGQAVAARRGLAHTSVAAVVEQANASKGAFFHHFSDRDSFLLAIHEDFHERMTAELERARAGLPPGQKRLFATAEAYWRFCLNDLPVRALLLEARGQRAVAEASRSRAARSAADAAEDLRSMGVSDARAAGALAVAMATEVSLLELEAGTRLAPPRRAFKAFLTAMGS